MPPNAFVGFDCVPEGEALEYVLGLDTLSLLDHRFL